MRTLIVEDEFVNRLLLQRMLDKHGEVHIAVTGEEAVDAVRRSLADASMYDLICLDIRLPGGISGHEALHEIRTAEQEAGYNVGQGARVVMTTAFRDATNVMEAFRGEADGYLVKPITEDQLNEQLTSLGLLQV